MPKTIDLGVERDHIESLTRASGVTAISELIWNSLDADSSIINIDYVKGNISNFESIEIQDNGHGLEYSKAEVVFAKLGGSEKKIILLALMEDNFMEKKAKGDIKH